MTIVKTKNRYIILENYRQFSFWMQPEKLVCLMYLKYPFEGGNTDEIVGQDAEDLKAGLEAFAQHYIKR